ncbi:MAG: poly(A) polymerase, partial [Thermoleophilaceae bacterium]|nr:poly(A) polymerase [Thermoleophilaceae bacterium]
PLRDLDLAVTGDPGAAAKAIARRLEAPAFQLSEEFGAWRVVTRDHAFTCDVAPLQGATIEEDLAHRDFAANAVAVPLAGGDPIDPTNGIPDIEARVLRVLPGAYESDSLRPLRLARLATELGFTPDQHTELLTLEAAHAVTEASPERIFAELRRLVSADRVLEGLALADRLGLIAAVLPELAALHGVEQSHFHHLDVHGHTLEVLKEQLRIERAPSQVFGADLGPRVAELLEEPLADGLTRAQALRFAALTHDIAKPATRQVLPNGRVTFIGHDAVGEEVIAGICRRLRTSERFREFLGAIARHHLVLGFLVHDRPLDRAAVYRYLRTCEPVEVEVTVLSCADRLATRGKNADRAIELHLELARELMEAALEWRSSGPPKAAVRGNRLAKELGMEPGPELGALLAELAEARYTGEATTPDEAVALARRLRQTPER